MNLIDIKTHDSEDNFKYREMQAPGKTVNSMISTQGFNPVKYDHLAKHTGIENWEHVVTDGSYSTETMHNYLKMTKNTWTTTEMTTTQILLYVNQILKPLLLSINSYKGKSDTIEHTCL